MIVWIPLSQSIWSPENQAKVLSRGIETEFSLERKLGAGNFTFRSGYSLTAVSRIDEYNYKEFAYQLIYVPMHTAFAAFNYERNKIFIGWQSNYTGVRFTAQDNSSELPAYIINNISSSYMISAGKVSGLLGFAVNNLFNTDYQSVEGYVLPGRTFEFSLKIKFGF